MSIGTSGGPEATRLIEAVHDLSPLIAGVRKEVEQARRLPAPLVEGLRDAGLFSLWLARAFGGPELSLSDFARVIEALARLDGSVAWCAMIAAALSRFSGYLPQTVARQIFVEQRAAVAGALAPSGRARLVPGGFRVTGRWSYGSGILHSDWTIGSCLVHEGGAPRHGPDGTPDVRIMFFPTTAAEVIDTWEVGGLRGTGSHDYQVTDLFVPTSHAVTGDNPLIPGPLYALSRHTVYPVSIAAVPLGIVRAALDAFRELSAGKTPQIGKTLLRDKPAVQVAIGRAESLLRSARSFLFEVCDEAWSVASSPAPLSLEQRALVRLACAQVAEATKAAIQIVYDAGGGTSVYESCPLQRCFRDVHAAAQHFQIHSANFESGGRVMLGLEPGTPHL